MAGLQSYDNSQYQVINAIACSLTLTNTGQWAGPVCHSTESLFGYYYVNEHNSLGSSGNLIHSTFIRRGLPRGLYNLRQKQISKHSSNCAHCCNFF